MGAAGETVRGESTKRAITELKHPAYIRYNKQAMKIYQDLAIRGSRPALDRFISEVEERLSDGWSRRRDREADVRRTALGPMYCFSCVASPCRTASELWIATRSDGALYVSNILPTAHSSLTYDEYNAIVQEFYQRFVRPAAAEIGLRIELGSPDLQIQDFLSKSSTELLRRFSGLANKSIMHSLDRKRWNEFLTAAHHERAPLTAAILQRWLIEEEKWPEDQAIDLAVEYEHARDLLGVYQSQEA